LSRSRLYLVFGPLIVSFMFVACGTAPRREAQAPIVAEGGPPVTIYVVRRSWHIDIGFDAAGLHPPLATLRQSLPQARYLLFGFGDKHYLLTHGRALGRLSGAVLPGEGVVLLTGLEATPAESFGAQGVVRLTVSAAQSRELERFVWNTLVPTQHATPTVLAAGPYSGSLYYSSVQRYSGLHTCNTWAAEALRSAGLPVHSFGVEFAGQLWRQVRRISRKEACSHPDRPPSSPSSAERLRSSSAGEAGCCC
jgi:Protein of unknown function (DUF2459)